MTTLMSMAVAAPTARSTGRVESMLLFTCVFDPKPLPNLCTLHRRLS
jgi:hypothetical protein